MLEKFLPVWTIRIALFLMFVTFALLLAKPSEGENEEDEPDGESESGAAGSNDPRNEIERSKQSSSENYLEGARNAWLLGSFFSLLHAIATMVFIHQGSHDVAVEYTAKQTESLLGFGFGIGIYFNYAFVIIWLVDALWWIAQRKTYEARNSSISWAVYGFLIFIAFNGSIVFESGWVRWFAIAGVIVLGLLAWRRSKTG